MGQGEALGFSSTALYASVMAAPSKRLVHNGMMLVRIQSGVLSIMSREGDSMAKAKYRVGDRVRYTDDFEDEDTGTISMIDTHWGRVRYIMSDGSHVNETDILGKM